jgi:hypothetical protein
MINRSPHSLTQAATRLKGSGQIAGFLLLSAVLLLPSTVKAGLPRFAFSTPPGQSVADSMKAAEQCGLKGKSLMMPALTLRLAGEDGADTSFEDQAKALLAISDDADVFLHVAVATGALTGRETERQITDRVAAFLRRVPLMSPMVHGLIIDVDEPFTAPDLAAFGIIDLAVAAKGAKTDLRLVFAFPAGFTNRQGDTVKRVATYFDLLGITYAPGWDTEAKWIAEQALNKPILLKVSPAQPSSYLAAALAATETTAQMVWSDPPDQPAFAGLCALNTLISRYITNDMNPLVTGASSFSLAMNGSPPTAIKWFAGGPSGDTAMMARVNGTPAQPRALSLHGAAGTFEIQWYDALTGAKLPTGPIIKTERGVDQTASGEAEYALVLIHNIGDTGDRFIEGVEVKGKADLTIQEIIARWQQYREAQRQRLDNYMADVLESVHFEGTNIGSGFDIQIKFEEFVNRDSQQWEQVEFYVNGVKFGNNHEFPLPQIDPTKVVTQPLELALNEKYQYKLLGTDKVNGILCYVIGVEPRVRGEVLFSGKIWIDGTTFRQVKQYFTERGEKSNVVSNTETQNFELVSDGKGGQFNLVKSISAQQLLNAAGRDFVLQKTYEFSGYAINNTEFAGSLTAARESDNPMFQDTDTGLRRLLRKGNQRVLDTSSGKLVRSIVVGTMYEGTFSFPIPIAGISIADFNYRNTGAQLSVFFAGPILVTNLSKQYGSKFRLGVDLALSGIPGNNRLYTGSTELKNQSIYTWEEDTGLRATWLATTDLSLTASGYLSYEYYHRTSDTDKLFALPRDGVTLLPSAEMKYAHKGYVFSAQGTRGQRLGWTPFGFASQPQPTHSAFTRYYADFAKTYYMPKFTRLGWEFGYFGGDQLDRISRYWPSFFSVPRLHGIPGGTDSFDAIAMGNVSYGFNVLDLVKIEGLYSYARARDIEESRQFKKFDGAELNFGTVGPWGTFLQGTVSYALDGNIDRYNSRWGVLFMMFKPLR